MNIILSIACYIFGILVGFKLIGVGWHWIREGLAELMVAGDDLIHTTGKKVRRKDDGAE